MAEDRICVTSADRHRLYLVLEGFSHHLDPDHPEAAELEGEIARAAVVAPTEAEPDLVTMRSRIRVTDEASGMSHQYTLVYPSEADVTSGRISVLAPLGKAVIGRRAGDVVEVPTDGGWRRLRIDALLYQPEAAGDYHL